MLPFIELFIAIIISIVYYQILLIGVVEMNPMEMLKGLTKRFNDDPKVLFDDFDVLKVDDLEEIK